MQESLGNHRSQAEQQAQEREKLELELEKLPEDIAQEIRLKMCQPRDSIPFTEQMENMEHYNRMVIGNNDGMQYQN